MEELTHYHNILNMNEWFMFSVVVVLIISLVSLNRQRKLQQQQSLSMESLQCDLRALANAAVGVGGRVIEIERQQRKRTVVTSYSEPQKQATAPIEFYNASNQPYEQAIRMAQTGANVDDIVNVCGLSRSEADLVSMMHRLDKVS